MTTAQQNDNWGFEDDEKPPETPKAVGYPYLQWGNKAKLLKDPNNPKKGREEYNGYHLAVGKFPDFDAVLEQVGGIAKGHIQFGEGNVEEHWLLPEIEVIPLTYRLQDPEVGMGLEMFELVDRRDEIKRDGIAMGWTPRRDGEVKVAKGAKAPIIYKDNGYPMQVSFVKIPVLLRYVTGQTSEELITTIYPLPITISFEGPRSKFLIGALKDWRKNLKAVMESPVGSVFRKALSEQQETYLNALPQEQAAQLRQQNPVVLLCMTALTLGFAEYVPLGQAGRSSESAVPGLILPETITEPFVQQFVISGYERVAVEALLRGEIFAWAHKTSLLTIWPEDLVLPERQAYGQRAAQATDAPHSEPVSNGNAPRPRPAPTAEVPAQPHAASVAPARGGRALMRAVAPAMAVADEDSEVNGRPGW